MINNPFAEDLKKLINAYEIGTEKSNASKRKSEII